MSQETFIRWRVTKIRRLKKRIYTVHQLCSQQCYQYTEESFLHIDSQKWKFLRKWVATRKKAQHYRKKKLLFLNSDRVQSTFILWQFKNIIGFSLSAQESLQEKTFIHMCFKLHLSFSHIKTAQSSFLDKVTFLRELGTLKSRNSI